MISIEPFALNVDGGYAENKSRLSDITLRWMFAAASVIPNGIDHAKERLVLEETITPNQDDPSDTSPIGLQRFAAADVVTKSHRANRFYAVISAPTLEGVGLAATPVDPIAFLFWAAVINGIISAPIM